MTESEPKSPEAKEPEPDTEQVEAPGKVIDRIRRLLALTRSDNAHEAAAAAAGAQRLLQQYRLSEEDVTDDAGDGSKITEIPLGAEGFHLSWKFALASAVARAMFCEAIALVRDNKRRVRIVGKRDDATAAAAVFKFLSTEIESLADDEMNEPFVHVSAIYNRFSELGYREAFCRGAALGAADRLKLESAKFARSSAKALVVVKSSKEELHDYLKNRYGDSKQADDGGAPLRDEEMEAIAQSRGYVLGTELQAPTGAEAGQKLLDDDKKALTKKHRTK